MKGKWGLIMCVGIAILLAGCGDNQADEPAKPNPEGQQPQKSVAVDTVPDDAAAEDAGQEAEEEPAPLPFTFPLTGLGTLEEHKDRPVMVMVENQAKARPQSGLHKADIVYEILAEGDITRFVALFQSESPDIIGPVRSIRPYFAQLGAGLDALIVHAGWSQEAMNLIAQKHLAHFDQVYGDDAYYWRSNERKAPHNLYTSIEKIRQGAVDKGFREEWNDPQFTFLKAVEAAAFEPQGQPANKVTIPYIQGYHVSYRWNAELGKYERYMLDEPHKDKETGTQLVADNVLILKAKHQIVDNVGRRHVDVFGPGNGYLVQQGEIRKVTWANQGGILRAFIDDVEVPLLPGKTWVQVVPLDSEITVE